MPEYKKPLLQEIDELFSLILKTKPKGTRMKDIVTGLFKNGGKKYGKD